MQTLNELTQSHLSVLILDKDSHNPIARMPIYAEVSIIQVQESRPYEISREDLGAIAENIHALGRGTLEPIVKSALHCGQSE